MTLEPRVLASPSRLANRLTDGAFAEPRHLAYLSDRIAGAIARGNARLVIACPPQHGKSTLISRWTPVWDLALNPDHQIGLACYEARFAAWHGGAARDLAVEHGGALGIEVVNGGDAAAADWETAAGGRMFSTGVGGPLTGRGFDLLVLDDVVKNHEEAESVTIRQAHWDWYESTARTRLRPGGSIVVVMTRWHPDDLAGRLLRQSETGGEHWEEIRLPALAEAGDVLGREADEALWPERYDFKSLEVLRRSTPRKFASMYQGRPRLPEGAMFLREWFREIDAPMPIDWPRVRAWDLAGTEPGASGDPDWTVGALLAMQGGKCVIEDVVRMRGASGAVRQCVKATAERDGYGVRIKLQQDPGQAGKDQIASYSEMLAGYVVSAEPMTGDKVTRAEPFASAALLGNVSIVLGPWNADFLGEVELFPGAPHDDQADAASDGYNFLSRGAGSLLAALARSGLVLGAVPVPSRDADRHIGTPDRAPGPAGRQSARESYVRHFG